MKKTDTCISEWAYGLSMLNIQRKVGHLNPYLFHALEPTSTEGMQVKSQKVTYCVVDPENPVDNSGCVSYGYTQYIQGASMKESGLRIRVEDTLRSAFIKACHMNDTTAAQAIRAFMREYVEQVENAAQGELFQMHFGKKG